MALFKRKENRAAETESTGRDSGALDMLFAGDVATREQALQIPTVQACISKIADSVSMLPVRLYRKTDGKPEEILDDSRVKLLNGETGDTLNTVEFWKALINDYYVGFGGWAFIHTSGGQIFSLHYVDSRQIGINQNADPIFKAYSINVGGSEYYDFKFIKLLRKTIDGYTNIPIQKENSKVISAAYNSLKLEIKMSKSGGTKGGFLKSKNKLSKEVMEDIRKGYESLYDSFNEGRNNKILILNDGMEFQEVSATSAEMQVNENKKTNAIEICKMFGFPHTIIDGGASEQDRRQFIAAVTALLNQIETELDAKLLLESEKESGYYWAFDTKELTRGSQKERYEAYEIGLRNHFLQPDEVRKEEDYEPMGFNFISIGLGDVLLNPSTGEVYTPNTNTMTKINSGASNTDESVSSEEERADKGNNNAGQRWLKDEHGKFCGSSSLGNSGSSGNNPKDPESGESSGDYTESVDKLKKDDIIDIDDENKRELKRRLESGELSSKVHKNNQSKHKLGSDYYKSEIAKGNLPSYTELSNMEIQQIINEYCCTGAVTRNGEQFKETITLPYDFAMCGNLVKGKYEPTNRGTIHYSKKGAHLVPTYKI